VAGGALPVALSDTLRALRERGLLAHIVAAAPCFDAEVQCVNVYSALTWCATRADVVVCSVGPGLVGTGSELGHGAVAAASAANAASSLGGRPILAVRISDRDERDRHRGISHHASTVEALCLGEVTVACPDAVDASGWREACAGLPLSFMGRGPDEEPRFFEAAYAAGLLARAEVA
jgi:hypothetical protein